MQIDQKDKNDVVNLALDTLKLKKQALVFVNTKRSAEKEAEEIAKKCVVSSKCEELAEKIQKTLPQPTKQCIRLTSCVKKGIAFHHAGLHAKQKEYIEDAFRDGLIKVICATPTLCLSGSTKIWHGCFETEVARFDKSNELFVLSNNNLLCMKAQKIQKNMNSENLIRITSVSGHKIDVTPNHKMMIKKNGKKLILAARNIEKRDRIATIGRLSISKPKNPALHDFVIHNECEIKNQEFNDELAYFIGVMIGGGYSGVETTNDQEIIYKDSPQIVGVDKEVFSQVEKICKQFNLGCRKTQTYHGTPSLVLGKNKWFREFLVRCGVEKRDKKHISDSLMHMDLENTKGILRGLFDTNGHVHKKRHVGFDNISEKLVKQMQKLLLRFGIISRIRVRNKGPMNIYGKSYETAPSFELVIVQKKSIIDFQQKVGFHIERKQNDLNDLVDQISSNLHYISCESCKYKVHKDIFSGRTLHNKKWGRTKLEVIQLLGEKGELGSREIKRILGVEPRKNERKINTHYDLIKKRRVGSRSKTEWFWSLNTIGQWIYTSILKKKKDISDFFKLNKCPLCKQELKRIMRAGWRTSDFEGDIFWDIVRNIEKIKSEPYVYDVVLSQNQKNDHMFLANGFIVHNSAGLDLPAFRAIIRDTKRYGGSFGMVDIPVLEFLQMVGRAGRPKFDEWGEGICIARQEAESTRLFDTYVNGVPESIYSKLAVEPVFRMYLLSLIATRFVGTKKEIMDFFSKTFWAHQYKDLAKIEKDITNMLEQLRIWGFLTKKGEADAEGDISFVSGTELMNETYEATLLGKRVAELYLDPLTAHTFLVAMEKAEEIKTQAISFLQLICNTLEMRPYVRIRQKDWDWINEEAVTHQSYFMQNEPSAYELEYESWFDSFKTALMMQAWIEEKDDVHIMEKFGVRPGESRIKLQRADWLLYALDELTRVKGMHELRKDIRRVRTRVKYGVKEELLPLIKIKGVGRVRARRLFKNNITSVKDVNRASLQTLTQILGPRLALQVKGQTSGDEPEPVSKFKRKGQMGLKKWS